MSERSADVTDSGPSTEKSSSGWMETEYDPNSLLVRFRGEFVGVACGVVGGWGAFMFSRHQLAPQVLPFLSAQQWGLSVAALAGVFTYLLAVDIRESVRAMLVGFFVALATVIVARIAPMYLLSYAPQARDLLIKEQLRYAAHTMLNVLILVYWGGYLGAVFVLGYFNS